MNAIQATLQVIGGATLVLLLMVGVLTVATRLNPASSRFEDNVQDMRKAQRDCLDGGGRFAFNQVPGGWDIRCGLEYDNTTQQEDEK